MKKTIVSIIAMLTAMTHSYGVDEMQSIKLQMLDSEIEKLTQERDTKYEELKKCEKTTKGFKIAGITTLSLTAVGVAANIGEAHKIKENKGIIISNDATIKAKEEAIRKAAESKQEEPIFVADRMASCKAKLEDSQLSGFYSISKSVDGQYCVEMHHDKIFNELDIDDGSCSDTRFNELSDGQWKIKLSSGEVTGTSKCGTNEGELYRSGNPGGDNGKNCWCKIINTTLPECRDFPLPWIVAEVSMPTISESEEYCVESCAQQCLDFFRVSYSYGRSALFGM